MVPACPPAASGWLERGEGLMLTDAHHQVGIDEQFAYAARDVRPGRGLWEKQRAIRQVRRNLVAARAHRSQHSRKRSVCNGREMETVKRAGHVDVRAVIFESCHNVPSHRYKGSR